MRRRRRRLGRNIERESSAPAEPDRVRFDGESHPVPLSLGLALTLITFLFVALSVALRDLALLSGVAFFGGLATFFWFHAIPGWIEFDAQGFSFRDRLRVRRVLWSEVEALGLGIANEATPGWMTVRLTPEARESRRRGKKALPDSVSVPAFESLRQDALHAIALERWQDAGGDGKSFTFLGELKENTEKLLGAAKTLESIDRRANPGTYAFLDAIRDRPDRDDSDKPAESDDEIYESIIHVRDAEKLLFFCLVIGGKEVGDVCAAVRRTSEALVKRHRFDPEFSGVIQVSLVPALTPDTPELHWRMDALVVKLAAELARRKVVTVRGRPITLSWAHGEPK